MKLFNQFSRHFFSCNAALIAIPLLLIIPNICLDITEKLPLWTSLTNILLPLGAYTLAMSLCPRNYLGALVLLPFIILAAFQIVLLFLYHGSIIAVDMFLNVATTNTGEAMELLRSLTGAMATVLALYLPVIIWSIVRLFRPDQLSAQRRNRGIITACVLLTCGCFSLVLSRNIHTGHRTDRDLFPVNVCHNLATAIDRMNKTARYHDTSARFRYNAQCTHPLADREIYIMVIGETSRADNFGILGYERNTTPELRKLTGLTAYSKVLSESNTTHKSVPMLMSTLTAQNFDSIYFRKSIITAFKEAGFHTAYFSIQKRNHSFIDFFGDEADEVDFISERKGYIGHDIDLIDDTRQFIARNSNYPKLLVVLHTYGSHFNYNDRYRPDRAHFTPDNCDIAEKHNRPRLINAYDNTVLNVDRTLGELARLLNGQNNCLAAMVYAADHGEDIFDDDRARFLHASPTPTYWQLHVPLMVWMSDSYRRRYPLKHELAQAHKALNVSSSRSLSPTLMDLAGVTFPGMHDDMALTSCSYVEPERVYLTDHNEAMPLNKVRLNATDFAMLKQSGIDP